MSKQDRKKSKERNDRLMKIVTELCEMYGFEENQVVELRLIADWPESQVIAEYASRPRITMRSQVERGQQIAADLDAYRRSAGTDVARSHHVRVPKEVYAHAKTQDEKAALTSAWLKGYLHE